MKTICYIFLLIFYCLAAFGQSQNNHWQLGKSDVNFSTNPGSASTVSSITGNNYGKASVSDGNGNLLFYTDGITIWNKNHQIMTHGQISDYGSGAVDEVIIVQNPANTNQYYVVANRKFVYISVDDYSFGYYIYCLVDFTNNSLGDLAVLNPSLGDYMPDTDETKYTSYLKDSSGGFLQHKINYAPIAAVKIPSGEGSWIVVQDENAIYSYKVDANGLSATPIVSTFSAGTIYNYSNSYGLGGSPHIGIESCSFRIVPSYSNSSVYKLYSLEYCQYNGSDIDILYFYNIFHSLTFNTATGVCSSPSNIPLGYNVNGGMSKSFEFSNDYQKVYLTVVKLANPSFTGVTNGEIRVLDLSNGSHRALYTYGSPTTSSSEFLNIQKDKYGNLLLTGIASTANKDKYLHKIDSPDSYSTSSVIVNYLSLNGNAASALPRLVDNITQQCAGSITLTTTETAISRLYKSSDVIQANTNYTVNSGSNIKFNANNLIILGSNTVIKSGAYFEAKIADCFTGRPVAIGKEKDESTQEQTMSVKGTFTLYPNPANSRVNLSATDGIKAVLVTSLDGKVMYNRNYSDIPNNTDLDISSYAQGYYMVSITTNKGEIQTQKLIKN
ncbi:T9SS type A sorting domain-containing protein [Flavobacterium sp. RHBU_3]|uniref:T9SS type A sorting domain-containing protein n=1 Tax=Flavobacterium sp. RHBU_3 TaxID=3391184 RepID=UPI003984B416